MPPNASDLKNTKFRIFTLNRSWVMLFTDTHTENLTPKKCDFWIQGTWNRVNPTKSQFWKFDPKQFYFLPYHIFIINIFTIVIITRESKKL